MTELPGVLGLPKAETGNDIRVVADAEVAVGRAAVVDEVELDVERAALARIQALAQADDDDDARRGDRLDRDGKRPRRHRR